MTLEDTTKFFTSEETTTVRFQLAYGVGMIIIALVTFWIASGVFTADIRYVVLAIGAIIAIRWLMDGLTMLSDVSINIMKMKNGKD